MELVQATKISQWQNIYRLYKSAFPKCERKPFPLIWLIHKKGNADVWVLEANGGFAGFAITLNLGDLVLLDYFAVADAHRSKGYGSQALRQLQERYRDRRFFLEIESVYHVSENLPERRRRKRFYLRNGMTEMRVMADVFGTPMELLGYGCRVEFGEYQSLYRKSFGKWALRHLTALPYPETE